MIYRAAVAALIVVALPVAAWAVTANGQQMMRNWAASNRCAQAAQRAFPDYTAEANAKRDAQLKQCLAGSNLPPRPSLDAPAKP
jgi:hypothetical protein